MADLPVTPVTNYGQMLGSYGEALADQSNAQSNQLSTWAKLPFEQQQIIHSKLENQQLGLQIQNMQNAMSLPRIDPTAVPGLKWCACSSRAQGGRGGNRSPSCCEISTDSD